MKVALVCFLFVLVCTGSVTAQLGPCATPAGPLLPDLIVAKQPLKKDRSITQEFIATNSCQYIEGCIATPGLRRLLRFTTTTPNIGETALFIGAPAECSLLFHFSECHGHYHLEQFTEYRLWTKAGYKAWRKSRDWSLPVSDPANQALLGTLAESGEFITGRKQGFCMLDSLPYKSKIGAVFHDCIANQGISAGWADVYDQALDCQYIDITGLAPGKYTLEVEVNPDRILPEHDYQNNSTAVPVRVRN
ncbi:MAG: hypothetical protein PCFJNLEI_03812 [Verrucomicrobiae bacterium]|nr:hypothetical protein [Verrucomicrobiae bacterium]